MGERRGAYWALVGKLEKRPLLNLRGWYEGWNFNSCNYLFTTDTK